MRRLTDEESNEETAMLRDVLSMESFRALWTDDNSNYAVVFSAGPLEGMVALIDHEEPLLVPVFTSVAAFEKALSEVDDWADLRHELPSALAASSELHTLFMTQAVESEWAAHVALQFIGPADLDSFRSLMASDAMWIQERACVIAGQLGVLALVPELERVAREGMPNGRGAAMRVLSKLKRD